MLSRAWSLAILCRPMLAGCSIYESRTAGIQHTLAVGQADTAVRQKLPPHISVVGGREVLREVVRQVCMPWAPEYSEVVLCDAVPDPIVSHVDRLRPALLDRVVGEAGGARVVGLDGGRGLGETQLAERGAHGFRFLCIHKQGREFRFGR